MSRTRIAARSWLSLAIAACVLAATACTTTDVPPAVSSAPAPSIDEPPAPGLSPLDLERDDPALHAS